MANRFLMRFKCWTKIDAQFTLGMKTEDSPRAEEEDSHATSTGDRGGFWSVNVVLLLIFLHHGHLFVVHRR